MNLVLLRVEAAWRRRHVTVRTNTQHQCLPLLTPLFVLLCSVVFAHPFSLHCHSISSGICYSLQLIVGLRALLLFGTSKSLAIYRAKCCFACFRSAKENCWTVWMRGLPGKATAAQFSSTSELIVLGLLFENGLTAPWATSSSTEKLTVSTA
jgi:hypothetical protein